jgi:hypothetical protein
MEVGMSVGTAVVAGLGVGVLVAGTTVGIGVDVGRSIGATGIAAIPGCRVTVPLAPLESLQWPDSVPPLRLPWNDTVMRTAPFPAPAVAASKLTAPAGLSEPLIGPERVRFPAGPVERLISRLPPKLEPELENWAFHTKPWGAAVPLQGPLRLGARLVGVAVGAGGVPVGVGGTGVPVAVGVCVGVGVSGVPVAVAVGVAVCVGVAVAVGVAVGVSGVPVAVSVGVAVCVGVNVGVDVATGVDVP